jgi:Bacterial surface proteins containing Ig-like domains
MSVRWIENYTSVANLLKILAKEITNGGLDTNWTLVYPANLALVDRLFTIKTKIGLGVGEDIFIEFYRPAKVGITTKDNNFYLEVRFGKNYTVPAEDNTPGTFELYSGSIPSRFSWFKTSTVSNIQAWLPVQYWLSVTDKNISMILAGDPSANFDDRLVSFGYVGQLKSFDNSVIDLNGNFGVTFSSDVAPYDYLTNDQLNTYSDMTGTGISDFCMLQTSTGFPFQSHFASFTTPDEFVNKKFEGPSNYTKKYHMSPVYIIHGYDGYRGELEGVVASDRSSIVEFDEMVHKDFDNNLKNTYKVFMVNAPYSIFNNSTNVLYAIALLEKSETLGNTVVTGATLTASTIDMIVGGTYQLGVNVFPLDATNKSVTWGTGDNTIATVDSTGKITAVSSGTTNITATTQDGSYVASCIVTVTTA